MKYIISLLLSIICTLNIAAAWNYHYWTAEEVYAYDSRNIDLIGELWWMQEIDGTNDISNIDEIGEKPLYFKMLSSPKPYIGGSMEYGIGHLRLSYDLMSNEWIELGTWRVTGHSYSIEEWKEWRESGFWRTPEPWDEITIPIWDIELAETIRNSKSLFIDVGHMIYIHKWDMYDGDKSYVLLDYVSALDVEEPPFDENFLTNSANAFSNTSSSTDSNIILDDNNSSDEFIPSSAPAIPR